MFVPVIPIIPNTKVVNKSIVYSDTVLNIKEKGADIQVSSIDNVKESELTNCLKTIFENNKEVVFHTIQYSKNNNKLYFYTNKEINTKVWKNSKVTTLKHFNSTQVLNEIKKILIQDENTDENVISLLNISLLMKNTHNKYERFKRDSEYYLQGKSNDITLYDFDYKTNELTIGIRFLDKIYRMSFSKQDDDLFITKSNYFDGNEIFNNLGSDLSRIYDEFIEFKNFKTENSYGINTINTDFNVNVSCFDISFFNRKNTNSIFNNGFELTSYSYTSKYKCECNSLNILSIIKGNEDELFRRIYVDIEDTPKWCHDILYEVRNKELEQSKSLKEKIKLFIKRHF